jgi:drug/metabolite transporter (DMT)-like permease
MSRTGDGPRPHDPRGAATTRPAAYIFGAAALVVVAAAFLSGFTPDLFASLGGWATVVVIVVVAIAVGSFSMLRRMRRLNAMPDEPQGRRQD